MLLSRITCRGYSQVQVQDRHLSKLYFELWNFCSFVLKLVQEGRYQQALELMDTISSETLRVLKHQQYWVFSTGLIKLRRYLHRFGSALNRFHVLTII